MTLKREIKDAYIENGASISTQGVGIGIIDSYLYYQFCYDWIRVQFRTNSTITQKRVYYGIKDGKLELIDLNCEIKLNSV